MKTLRLLLSLLVLVAMSARSSFALDFGFAKEDGGHAGAFLEFAASARSLGMGGAHTAVADDASAGYWNPAGLSQIDIKNVVAQYSNLYEETSFGSFSFAQPTVDMGTFGVGLVSLRSGNFGRRDSIGNKNGTFSTSETAVLLSHGIELGNNLSLGSTVKLIREEVDTFASTGYGLDVAGLWRASDRLQLGLALRNLLAPELQLRQSKDKYPMDVRLGLKYQLLSKLMLATDVNKTQDRSVKLHVGTEWKYNPNLLLRVGINESEVTAGLGIKIGRVGVDYAFGFQDAVGGVEDLGSSHRFGFNFHFGGKVSDQEVSLRWQKKGQIALADLRAKMSEENPSHDDKLQKALTSAKQVIRHQGYLRPQDLYAAQGYISFFEGQFERSVQSLGEAAVLDADNLQLKDHLEFARAQMAEGRSREIVSYELKRVKDMYEKGDWKGTVKSCEKILSFRPDHADAFVYLEDAKARINEPIQREMKIAKMKFEKQEYLDAIKSFQKVKEMDPENKEAAQYISFSIAALEKQAQVQSSMAVNSIRPVYEIERNSDKSRELYSKGLLLYSQGKMQEASAVWAQAVKYDDTNVLARNAYNRSQIELKEQAQ